MSLSHVRHELDLLRRREFDDLSEGTIGLLLVAPLVTILCGLYLYPVLRAFWFSLHEVTLFLGESTFIGHKHYLDILMWDRFHNALFNGIVYTVASVLLTLIIGIGTALLLNRTFVGERIATGLILSPYLIPIVGTVLVFRWFFDGLYGVGNYVLVELGLISEPIAWFSSSTYAMPMLILISGWRLYPFVTMLVLAKLQTIPEEYYEAARIMGASKWTQFWKITIPQLRNVLFVAILLRMLWTFNLFDIIWLGTQGGPGTATETLPVMAYRITFNGLDLGEGAAVAFISCLVLVMGTLVYFRLYGMEDN